MRTIKLLAISFSRLTHVCMQVSKLFENRLGRAYIPGLHWTSPLRTRAGLLPYHSSDENTSTFTIEDGTGALISFAPNKRLRTVVSIIRDARGSNTN